MPILKYLPQEYIITVTYKTPLLEVLKIINKENKNKIETDIINQNINSVFIVEKSKLLGILSFQEIIKLVTYKASWTEINAGEVMSQSVINVTRHTDTKLVFSVMQEHGVNHLPIVDDVGKFLGIVTSKNIVELLQTQLLETEKNLQYEIEERCTLELTLAKTHDQQETRVLERTQELEETNKLLQHAMCDRIATEAQLLQTTSELQELFQAFPDVYLRLSSDGTILSCHAREIRNLYLPPDEFIGQKVQEIFPHDVGCELQQAIFQLHQTNSLVVIEYSLHLEAANKSFEARFLPSIQHQIVVIIRDITERKQAQEALQKAKDELEIRVEERTRELKKTNELLLQEIIGRKRIEDTLKYRFEFEKLITTISTHFINLASDKIDSGIYEALQSISEFMEVDCSYISLFKNNKSQVDVIYEWYSKEIQDLIIQKIDINSILLPWIVEKLSLFEIVHIPDINSSRILENPVVQHLIVGNIQSVIILPIVCSGNLMGSLIFESVRSTKSWTEESLGLLKMVGEMLGNVLRRKHVEQALRVSEERYARAINAGKVGIWELNIRSKQIYIDPNLKAMLGYSEHEISDDFNDWISLIHPQDIDLVKFEFDAYLEGVKLKYEIQHRMRHKNGHYLWFLARANLIKDSQKQPCYLAGSNTDITINKQIEDKLKISLKEKDILLEEIHHRVKNNLQIISSLLRLQVRHIKDSEVLNVFQDSHNRIRTMAIIHETLYKYNDFHQIKIYDYINNLIANIIRCYQVNCKINIKLEVDSIDLKIDTAVICGLIINELVSNSLKHAFINNHKGEIKIIFSIYEYNKCVLNISDNGIGINKNYLNQERSIGLQLVRNLVEQLEGSITCDSSSGTSFNITFFNRS